MTYGLSRARSKRRAFLGEPLRVAKVKKKYSSKRRRKRTERT